MTPTRWLPLGLLLTILTFSNHAKAEDRVQVLNVDPTTKEVSVTYDAKMRWAPRDSICFFTDKKTTVCGVVTLATEESLKVSVKDGDITFDRGAWVVLRRLNRTSASVSSSALIEQQTESKTHDISLGIATGGNYFFPMAHLQQALDKNFSIGLMPMFVDYSVDGASVTAWGAFATLNYYYTHFPFRGFYGSLGGGFYNIHASIGSSAETHTQGAAQATVSWRGRASWELGLDIGVSAGVQYVFPVQNTLTNNFSGLLPLVLVSLGYPF
jgi:hypothetical protein